MRVSNPWRGAGAIVALALAATALGVWEIVSSQAATNHTLDLRARAAVLKTAPDGASCRAGGYFRGRPLGWGGVVMRFTPEAFLTFTLYNKRGSISGRAKRERRPPGSCGRSSFEATAGRLTGTAAYEGAAGRLAISGTYDSGTGVLTLRARGRVRY
jgi:hypothetical protein